MSHTDECRLAWEVICDAYPGYLSSTEVWARADAGSVTVAAIDWHSVVCSPREARAWQCYVVRGRRIVSETAVPVAGAPWQAQGFRRLEGRHGLPQYDDSPVVVSAMLSAARHAVDDADRLDFLQRAEAWMPTLLERLERGQLDVGYPSHEAARDHVREIEQELERVRAELAAVRP